MRLELDPPRGVGDVQIGMSVDAAERVLKELPGFVPPAPGERRNKGFAHYSSELSISLDFDSLGVVRAVEAEGDVEGFAGALSALGILVDESDPNTFRLKERR